MTWAVLVGYTDEAQPSPAWSYATGTVNGSSSGSQLMIPPRLVGRMDEGTLTASYAPAQSMAGMEMMTDVGGLVGKMNSWHPHRQLRHRHRQWRGWRS